MRCPSSLQGFCPSQESINVHHSEWTSEYYCTTCGYENVIKHDRAQKIKPQSTAVSRPKSKYKENNR